MAQELNKIAKKKELPPIVRKPDDPGALYRSKADQLAINKKKKQAQVKANEAYAKAMKEAIEPEVNEEVSELEKGLIQQKQLVKTLTKTGADLKEELAETAPGEQRPVKMLMGKNRKAIERAEAKIEEIEEDLSSLS